MKNSAKQRTPIKKRIRRSAEEARKLILDAAEERLATQGPQGLRLQEIAKDAGISHPTILHHFDSREHLIRALASRIAGRQRHSVMEALLSPTKSSEQVDMVLNQLFDSLSSREDARLLAWLELSRLLPREKSDESVLSEVTNLINRRQQEACGSDVPLKDTQFIILLASLVSVGDAIMGPAFRAQDEQGEAALSADFKLRFAALIKDLLARSGDKDHEAFD